MSIIRVSRNSTFSHECGRAAPEGQRYGTKCHCPKFQMTFTIYQKSHLDRAVKIMSCEWLIDQFECEVAKRNLTASKLEFLPHPRRRRHGSRRPFRGSGQAPACQRSSGLFVGGPLC